MTLGTTNREIAMPVLGYCATAFYLAELKRLRKPATLSLQLLDIDFNAINANLPDKYSNLIPLLDNMLRKLEKTGAPLYVIPNITLHDAILSMSLDKAILDRIINPIACGITHLEVANIHSITLAGSRHTMQTSQLANYFQAHNILVRFPAGEDIHELDKLRQAVFDRGDFKAGIKTMGKLLSGYDNVVLACTELSLLNTGENFIDLARLQIAATIARL